MRTGRVPIAALLLVLAFTVLEVETVGDLYLEGEEDSSNEFIEVKENEFSIYDHLKRIKRDFFTPFNWFDSKPDDNDDTVTESVDDGAGYGKDDDSDNGFGSGSLDKTEPEPKEKTLRVTFTVVEPYRSAYSNRDSAEFLDFSRSLANAVDQLFENLPGTQHSSLVRIQSLINDEFSCKVTLDIVTTGYEDTNNIKDILRNHIKTYNRLGKTTVNENEFSAQVIDPNWDRTPVNVPEDTYQVEQSSQRPETNNYNENREEENTYDQSIYNQTNYNQFPDEQNNFNQYPDENEYSPGSENGNQNNYSPTPPSFNGENSVDENNYSPSPDQNNYYNYPDNQNNNDLDNENNYGSPDNNQTDSESRRGDGGRQSETEEIPSVTTEDASVTEEFPYLTTSPRESYDFRPEYTTRPTIEDCPPEYLRCDETRCVEKTRRCDGRNDCDDGTDEDGCSDLTCGADDFRCNNGKCIESSRRCNRVYDCPDQEDERGCDCRPDEFRCESDGACIEERKKCDNVPHCSDGSDESHCPCRPNQWQCDHGSCIKRKFRCDGRVDCPTDRSDERNCIANGSFRCRNGRVIPEYLRCNRHYDCGPEDYSDEQNCPCGASDFKCDNGYCIPASKRCDRTHDCQDGSDEHHCTYGTICMAYEYECKNGMCVQAEARCNGTVECNDKTDETGCPCKRDQYPCRDGFCINIAFLCNGRNDCNHGEDEYNCKSTCSPDEFKCQGGSVLCAQKCNFIPECDGGEDEENCTDCSHHCDGRCLSAAQICDNRVDCSDSSDEAYCQYCNKPDDFRCKSGECLPFTLKCNGIPECEDSSDERYCNQTMITSNAQCTAEQFQCLSNLVCIDIEFYCDGHKDCLDGSDETNCPWYMMRASRSPTMITCHESEFTCYDGRCIPHSRRCDNIYDCSDFSDEQNCYNTECPSDSWQCRDGQCIPTSRYCDKIPDCIDGTDESDCDWTTQRTYVVTSTTGLPSTTANIYTSTETSTSRYPDSRYPDTRYPDSRYPDNRNPDSRYPDNRGNTDNTYPDSRGQNSGYPDNGYPDGNGNGEEGDRWNIPSGGYPNSNGGGENGENGENGYVLGSGYPDNNGGNAGESGGSGSGLGNSDRGDRWNAPGGGYPGGSNRVCSANEWRCENGPCINAVRRCDGHKDCPFDLSDELDCPSNSPVTLDLKTYPSSQIVRYATVGGDVVFQCRDEGPLRASVKWHMIGRPVKAGSTDVRGRLEMFGVTKADSGIYVCEAENYIGYPGSQVRVTLQVDNAPITFRPPFLTCQPYEATCGNGQCIPKAGVCNGRIDCNDGSDEENCHHEGMCEPNQFKCGNRKCVLKTWICDSEDDCGDGSDEQNCGSREEGKCSPVEFTCESQDQCIPKSFHCDGQSDCQDGSDEIGCIPVHVTIPPQPSNVRLNPGDTLILRSEAVGVPTPLISWRLNWGHVPAKCTWTSDNGIGILTCPNMQPEDSGAYSSEAINNKGATFATPDAIVIVNKTDLCPRGYFNDDARSESECIRCFCFGKSTQCRSADLFTYNMPVPLGEGGTRLVGIKVSPNGDVNIDTQPISNQYYYQPLRNGATITKFGDVPSRSNAHPYLTLPETYNGNQLKSYGGHIKYTLSPQTQIYGIDDSAATIIIKARYGNLFHMHRAIGTGYNVEARFTPEGWSKYPDGSVPATREDIMMALDDIQMILLRADLNNAGVNITDFAMESADQLNVGLGAASLVEECTCPKGYEGLSCQKCASGFMRKKVGPWLGDCEPEECPPGTYGDPSSGLACKPCPCPLTNRENQFARTCSLGPRGSVVCDCFPGYEGEHCQVCAPGYEGNPLIPGNTCQPKQSDNCNPTGTKLIRPPDECVCKVNVQGRYCDQCKDDSFFLSSDFRQGCATCFCTGVTQQCKSSNYRRRTISVQFNVPQIVDQVKIFDSAPAGLAGSVRYAAPKETNLVPQLSYGIISVDQIERGPGSNIYYWSMPMSFTGDKVTSYGGYLRYMLKNVPAVDPRYRNAAADAQIISDNGLTFHYNGNFSASNDGFLNASIQLLEDGWRRPDGGEISRPDFLLALADVKTILIKATYAPSPQLASPISASIDIAEPDANGPIAFHVEECDCPAGYIGTSCEDCAPGYTRSSSGLYLEHCDPCECNGKSSMCHPENGVCYDCADNTDGDHCERCKPGYTQDPYGNCIIAYPTSTIEPCHCDLRGISVPCDETGRCQCKQNVEGDTCGTCRPGTFGLDTSNPDGCLTCYCSGVTNDCHEGNHYTRVPIAAPVLGENYGGFTITDLNAERVIKDHFVPLYEQSELMYTFQFRPDVELYWSLPIFPGNRVLSYGGSLSLRQKFSSENDVWSERGTDVILDGGDISIFWTNPNQFQSGKSYTYQVPLKEDGWLILNTATPATRSNFMSVLRNLKRVLVRATVAPNIYESTIADVYMDSAIQSYDPSSPVAKGIEICMCPEGYSGTSCETCKSGYYKDTLGYCRKCSCNGHDCQLDNYGQVVCHCQPPYTGYDCSTIGLVMELHPTIQEATGGDTLSRMVTFTCKYRAPEPLTIKFYHQDREQQPVKYFNESRLEKDGWHGEHVWHTIWDTRQQGEIYECHTFTEKGFRLGVLTTSLPESGGDSSVYETTTRQPPPESTVIVTIMSPTIKIQEVGSSVNFTCQAQSRYTRRRLPVRWTKSDGNLPLGRTYVDENNGYLVITNLQVSDSGVYICETNDGINSAEARATLKVPGNEMTPPSVVILPAVKEYYEGDPIQLECRVKGNPLPSIRWQRVANKPLPLSAEIRGSLLIIDSARVEDGGEYRCTASNRVGIDARTAVITVRPRPSWPTSDKLTISNTSPTVEEGHSIRIVCTGSTNVPAGSIDWVRQDKALFLPNVRSENGVLYIESAESANEGVYICHSPQSNVAPVPVLLSVLTLNPEPEVYNITVSVDKLKIPAGGSGTIDCNPVGRPLPLVKWTKPGTGFGPDSSQRDNTLIINNARPTDEGYYLCEGSVDGVPVANVYVFVEVERREIPVVKIWPEGEQSVILGGEFELHCRVLSGLPEPYVTWSRNGGRPLSPSTEIQPHNVLKFKNIEVNDEGEYTCEARNDAGSATASAVIKVRSPPEITISPSDYVQVSVGEPINIDCRANGYPEPMVSISLNDRQLVSPQPGHAMLRLPSASLADNGYYTCTASSLAGSITNQFAVVVDRGDGGVDNNIFPNYDEGSGDGGIDTDERNPDWNNYEQPKDQYVIEGQPETVIFCNETGNVKWSRADNMPLQRNFYQSGTRLVIFNVSKSDSGEYICNIYNEYNEVQHAVHISLVVVTAPKITLRPQMQTVQPGQSPTVECVVEGDDITDITWKRHDRTPSERMEVRYNTLIFHQIEVEDAGEYECVARSRYANISAIAEVNVTENTGRTWVSHDREQWATAGAAVTLACNVTQPRSRVVWTKDGGALPKSVFKKRDGSLFIRLALKSDSGRYVCSIRDENGREITSNYINLHIQGYECLNTEFRCYDDSGCVEEKSLCDGIRHCQDNSDEENCLWRDKRVSDTKDYQIFDGPSYQDTIQLVSIEQPRTTFRVGDNVNVLCRIRSRDIKTQWVRPGTNQYIPLTTYGDGAMLSIQGVTVADAGIYRCIGMDIEGRTSYDDFELKVDGGSGYPNYPNSGNIHVAEYTAKLGDSVYLPCQHDLELPVTIEWKREFSPLPSDLRSNQPNLYLESVTEADAGTYICRVSNSRTTAEAMAILTIKGVVPRFDGKSFISLPTLKDAFRQFEIEISFKPTDENGLILYNSQNQGREGDFIALQLTSGVPEFIMNTGTEQIKEVKYDRPLQLNTWHTIRLSRTDSKVTMDVDNRGPFIAESPEQWAVLDLNQPMYIGGVPDYDQLPLELAGASGFIGCISMLILGRAETNLMIDSFERVGISECDTCNPNLCLNNGFCQEASNERGYMCICASGYAGLNCDRTGEACRPGLCGPGKCSDTETGYKCACPVTRTGKNCEVTQSIEYPAFTGSAYLAIKPPGPSRTLKMSMNIKAASPVTDGLIMYCAESSRGYGGFTSLSVHNGKLEFRYDLGRGSKPIVLISNRTLPANEWTNVHIARIGSVVSLKINSVYSYEERLEPPSNQWIPSLDTPIFVGGVDESITLNNNTGVSGGFNGCIKDFTMHGQAVDIVNQTIQSANVQECVSSVEDRGDIPEAENIVCQCRNGGQCVSADPTSCSCPYGFSGQLCEYRAPSSMREGRNTDPCAPRPCRNGGTCRPDMSSRMNLTCDCPLGFAGVYCQMPLELLQSVGFNGNGYLELPASLIDYSRLDTEPAVIALAIHTTGDGVLMYQKEAQSPPDYGDYILLRIERGIVVLDWDLGGGKSSVSVGEVFVNDGERHQVIAKLLRDGQVTLSVDNIQHTGTSIGISNIMNADSNIYLGGIPDHINQYAYPGFNGCIEQFELMDSHRGLNLGQLAVAGRNTQRCKEPQLYRNL